MRTPHITKGGNHYLQSNYNTRALKIAVHYLHKTVISRGYQSWEASFEQNRRRGSAHMPAVGNCEKRIISKQRARQHTCIVRRYKCLAGSWAVRSGPGRRQSKTLKILETILGARVDVPDAIGYSGDARYALGEVPVTLRNILLK